MNRRIALSDERVLVVGGNGERRVEEHRVRRPRLDELEAVHTDRQRVDPRADGPVRIRPGELVVDVQINQVDAEIQVRRTLDEADARRAAREADGLRIRTGPWERRATAGTGRQSYPGHKREPERGQT